MVLSSTPATASITSISCPWFCLVPRPRQASSASAAHGSVQYPGHGKHHEHQLPMVLSSTPDTASIMSISCPWFCPVPWPRQASSASAAHGKHHKYQLSCHGEHQERQLPMILSVHHPPRQAVSANAHGSVQYPATASIMSISCPWFCPVPRPWQAT